MSMFHTYTSVSISYTDICRHLRHKYQCTFNTHISVDIWDIDIGQHLGHIYQSTFHIQESVYISQQLVYISYTDVGQHLSHRHKKNCVYFMHRHQSTFNTNISLYFMHRHRSTFETHRQSSTLGTQCTFHIQTSVYISFICRCQSAFEI